jgi:hypothetical protein
MTQYAGYYYTRTIVLLTCIVVIPGLFAQMDHHEDVAVGPETIENRDGPLDGYLHEVPAHVSHGGTPDELQGSSETGVRPTSSD